MGREYDLTGGVLLQESHPNALDEVRENGDAETECRLVKRGVEFIVDNSVCGDGCVRTVEMRASRANGIVTQNESKRNDGRLYFGEFASAILNSASKIVRSEGGLLVISSNGCGCDGDDDDDDSLCAPVVGEAC